jgi:sirohydrochlorin ferrochelatase
MTDSKQQRRAILIVDHGTRDETARRKLARLATEVSRARPDWLVEHAHMELAEPDFDAGIDALVERGATHIFVHLHFLGAGYHVRQSIPELVEKAKSRHATIPIETSEPLGHDEGIVDLVIGRMDRHSDDDRQS